MNNMLLDNVNKLFESREGLLQAIRRDMVNAYIQGCQDVLESIRDAAVVFPTNSSNYELVIGLADTLSAEVSRIIKEKML